MECFFSEFKSLMFEGRMDKTAWQRPEFEANNPKFDKKENLTAPYIWLQIF